MKIFSNFSLKNLLYNRRFTIPFSIFAAFVLWLIIVIDQKPFIDRTFSNVPVSINLENTFAAENKMSIIGDISEQRFTVTVRGPRYVVSSLTASDLSLFASAGEVDAPGDYDLVVSASSTTNSAEFEVLSITPPVLKTTFDYIDTKEFTIVATAEGAVAADGLVAENGVVSGTESDTVTITGPRSIVNTIETVKALAEVNKTLSVSESFDANIILYDASGNVIETNNLTLSAKKVKVTVPISKKKSVPVKVEFSNIPAGFDSSSVPVSVDHTKVTVIGAPDTVDKTTEVVLSAIDITTVSESNFKFDVSPKLPEGVRLLENIETFNVTVDTSKFVSKTVKVSEIKSKGL
ncbi:MAG: hypothetical protein IKU41_08345, partial [Clostridia bacterium]|nr:hypothetical protein [Clostridia bacterium]